MSQSVGIIGGKPNHAYWFIGHIGLYARIVTNYVGHIGLYARIVTHVIITQHLVSNNTNINN